MSEVSKEVALQNELNVANNNIKGLIAQLEASKQMCNELIQVSFQLRTNIVLMQQNSQEEAKKKCELEAHAASLKAQLHALSEKVLELSPKPCEVPCPESDAA